MNDDGTVKRGEEVFEFANENDLKTICNFAKNFNLMLGNGKINPGHKELKIKKIANKSIYLKKDTKKWFVGENKAKYYYLCEHAVKNISIQSADNALIAMKNWRGYENLKNIKQDTLIIWGDRDVSYNFDQVDTLKKNISNSKLEIFKGCCHNVHLEEPQKFNETVKNFLE